MFLPEAVIIWQDAVDVMKMAWGNQALYVMGVHGAACFQSPRDIELRPLYVGGPDAGTLSIWLHGVAPARGRGIRVGGDAELVLRDSAFNPWSRMALIAPAVSEATGVIISQVDWDKVLRRTMVSAAALGERSMSRAIASAGYNAFCTVGGSEHHFISATWDCEPSASQVPSSRSSTPR
jgi:hypothetical protein